MTNNTQFTRKDVETILELDKKRGDDCSVVAQFTCDIPMHERDHVLEFYKQAPVMAAMLKALLTDMDAAVMALKEANGNLEKDSPHNVRWYMRHGWKTHNLMEATLTQCAKWRVV